MPKQTRFQQGWEQGYEYAHAELKRVQVAAYKLAMRTDISTTVENVEYETPLHAAWAHVFQAIGCPSIYKPDTFDTLRPDYAIGENVNIPAIVKPIETMEAGDPFLEGFTEAKIKRGPFWMMVALTFLVQLTGMLLLDHSTMPLGVALAVLGVLIANLYAWLVVTAGRCRDAGLSGWLAILTLIPVLGLTGVLIIGIAGSKSDS